MKRLIVLITLGIIFSGIGMSFALAASVTVTVDGRSGPWDTSLNPSYSYGVPVNGWDNYNWGPTIVYNGGLTWYVTSGSGGNWGNTAYTMFSTTGGGLPMTAGDNLTIQWLRDNVCGGAGGSAWTSGANGNTSWGVYSSPSGATTTPAVYIPPVQFPVNFMELMGVFADSTGKIVGDPFVIGNGPTTTSIPGNNLQLQMGFVDGWYNDNFATLQVTVTESPVPLPGAVWLLGSGLAGLIGFKRKSLG
jgi:hypothetical protein